jgi:CRP/FNR family transcriptional regulator
METTIRIPSTTGRAYLEPRRQAAGECPMCGAQKSCLSALFIDTDVGCFEGIVTGRRRVARDASLFRERDMFSTLFAVRFGQFKSTRRNSSGALSVFRFHMGGELIGLDAIASGRHGFRLTALENSEVCEISYSAITKIMAAQPQVLRRFLEFMSAALNDEAEHSSMLSRTSLDERFSSFLLELGAKYERLGYSGKSFRLGMTRADIGSYLGITVESVSRLISRFNAQSAVSISGRTVEIYDHDYLRAVLSGQAGKFARLG